MVRDSHLLRHHVILFSCSLFLPIKCRIDCPDRQLRAGRLHPVLGRLSVRIHPYLRDSGVEVIPGLEVHSFQDPRLPEP